MESNILSFNTSLRWGIKAGVAILDQGIFSGSNFILNVLLARWLRPDEYGAFSLAFAVYLFFTGFHNALVLEPMSVFGTSKYSTVLTDYLAGQLFVHFVVTALSGIIVLIFGLVLYYFQLVEEFLSLFVIGAGLFLPLMLLIWLARRACYVSGKPVWALICSLVYAVVLFFGADFIHEREYLAGPLSWYFLLGAASLAGSLLVYANPAIITFKTFKAAKGLSWLREQWSFGKWIVLAAFMNFAGTQIHLFVVAALLGLSRAGAFRALQNFMLPMMQVLTAVSTLVLPVIAFDFGKGNLGVVHSKAWKTAAGLIIMSVLYLIALLVFAESGEMLLYGGKFAELTSLVFVVGIVPLLAATEVGFSLVVRALQRPVYYAVSTGAMALTGIVFTPILVSLWGVQGAILALLLVALVSLALNMWFYRKWFVPKLVAEHEDND